MSTDYYITLTAANDTTVDIILSDSAIPFGNHDTWTTNDASALGASKGDVFPWRADSTQLMVGGGVGGTIRLDNLPKGTQAPAKGKGSKWTQAGTFPDEDFEWTLTKVV